MSEENYTFEHIRRNADSVDWEDIAAFAPIDILEKLKEDFVDELYPHEVTVYVRTVLKEINDRKLHQ